jgi:YD repeat-containing protein
LNRLSTVGDNSLSAGQNTTAYTYDPASNVATVSYPNGLQSSYSEPTQFTDQLGNVGTVQYDSVD